jgi:autotransporter-associated beta strand protein
MIRSFSVSLTVLAIIALSTPLMAVPMEIRLIGITGNKNTGPPDNPPHPDDEKLFEINLTNFTATPLEKLPFVPDTDAIGFNPEDGLLYRVSGSESYRNDPTRVGYNDNQAMQTVDVYTPGFPQTWVFNANPQGDAGFGPYGEPAPRPNFILPAERRTDAQTDPSFRQVGPNEYAAMRDLTWSSTEHLFYGADGRGIFRLTADGESTFVGSPGVGIEPKGISFFSINGERRLLLTDKDGPELRTIDPMTGQVVGDPVVLVNEGLQALSGVVSIAEHPDGSTLYGIANVRDAQGDPIARELIRIDPITGITTSLGFPNTGEGFLADLAFVYIEEPTTHTWNVNADGNWSAAANWTNGVPNGAGVAVRFLDAITAPRTVTIDGARTVGSLTFDNANSYTLGGAGPLTIDDDGAATIDVLNGSHTISAPLSFPAGQTVNKTGPGTLTLSGAQTHGAGAVLSANAGVTNLNSDGGTNLSLQANAAVNLGSTQHLSAVQIGAGATVQLTPDASKTLVTPTLTIAGTAAAPTGKLDLASNGAVINYTGDSPAAAIRQQILAGRGGTDLLGTWDGQGITSSTAAVDPSNLSVGFANNGDLPLGAYTNFRGEAVDDSTVLIRTTRTGDANLDGVVGDEDVTIVGATYGMTSGATWALGDFNYDGAVDDADVTLVSALYDPTATPLPAPSAGAVAAVPEPSTMVLLGAMAAGLLMTSRFRRRLSR